MNNFVTITKPMMQAVINTNNSVTSTLTPNFCAVNARSGQEMSNHLGNVLTVINDIKIPVSSNSVDIDGYLATIVSTADYSPFGVQLDGRTVSAESYRYGYQGSEKDDEVKGQGNSYTTEFRMLDPRLGRWLSIDRLASKFPWQSPYVSMDNNPICLNDVLGLESSKKKNKTPEFDKKSAREQRRAFRYAEKLNAQYDKEREEGNGNTVSKAVVYQYEKKGRYRYGVETQKAFVGLSVEEDSYSSTGFSYTFVQGPFAVVKDERFHRVANWWVSAFNDPFNGGLSYYSEDGQAARGKPFAGRYAIQTDGTIMPGAGGGVGASARGFNTALERTIFIADKVGFFIQNHENIVLLINATTGIGDSEAPNVQATNGVDEDSSIEVEFSYEQDRNNPGDSIRVARVNGKPVDYRRRLSHGAWGGKTNSNHD